MMRVIDAALAAIACGVSFVAQVTPALDDPMNIGGVVAKYGPLVALVLWFVWRDSKREERMEQREAERVKWEREELQALVKKAYDDDEKKG